MHTHRSKYDMTSLKLQLKVALLLINGILMQFSTYGQEDEKIYSSIQLDSIVILSENNFNAEEFISRVKKDTSFYQAFKNLRYYAHQSEGSIWVLNRKSKEKAFERMEVQQFVENSTMWQDQKIVKHQGKMRNRKGELKFTTAKMYYNVFFPADTSKVSNKMTSVQSESVGQSKMDQHKHDLKVMMFNPGEDVSGVPIVGDKMSIFDNDMVKYYTYKVTMVPYRDRNCYLFTCTARPEYSRHKTVIKSLKTYFDPTNMMVLKREYEMDYRSILFQFDVNILVENKIIKNTIVPTYISYNGYWDIPFQAQETLKFSIVNSNYLIK